MSPLDRQLLAAKSAIVERHLARVADRLPADPAALQPSTDTTDAVVLHLWQAVQITVDLAVSACVSLGLGAPASYGEAFLKLADASIVTRELAENLVRAAGFRNVVAHAYESLDLTRVHRAATCGPADLRALITALRDRV